ncbi:hypothetical protein D3C71_2135480 [compost metagenome]
MTHITQLLDVNIVAGVCEAPDNAVLDDDIHTGSLKKVLVVLLGLLGKRYKNRSQVNEMDQAGNAARLEITNQGNYIPCLNG